MNKKALIVASQNMNYGERILPKYAQDLYGKN